MGVSGVCSANAVCGVDDGQKGAQQEDEFEPIDISKAAENRICHLPMFSRDAVDYLLERFMC